MPVSTFTQPDRTTQDTESYKNAIDAAVAVLARLGSGFAPHFSYSGTFDFSVTVDAGSMLNRSTGVLNEVGAQVVGGITTPAAGQYKKVRIYIAESGAAVKLENVGAAPAMPTLPAGAMPICSFTLSSATYSSNNTLITDERAWPSGFGNQRNAFFISTSMQFPAVPGALFYELFAGGATGGAGAGATAAGGTNYGGGSSASGGTIFGRWWAAEALNIVIGFGGVKGISSGVAGTNPPTAPTAGGTTTITGVTSGNTISIAGTAAGGNASIAAVGAAGAVAATPTNGVAGTIGQAGTSGAVANGGTGPGCGVGAVASPKSPGGTTSGNTNGTNAVRSSGAGAGAGAGTGVMCDGGNGSPGWVLVKVY